MKNELINEGGTVPDPIDSYQECVLAALKHIGVECTRTQLLNKIQLKTDISPYNFISALDALEKQGRITQWEEHGTAWVSSVENRKGHQRETPQETQETTAKRI